MTPGRLPRDLHPAAWWVWALGLAAAATATLNPYLLLLVVAVASATVLARRSDHPWARAFKLYLAFGLVIVVMRVLWRILVGGAQGTTELFWLPRIPLPDFAAGITLLGPVTLESVLAGLYDGMRLAALVICIGAANALANPKRLLKAMPAALYEVGTAIVVAVSLLPQLGESVQRVMAARRLRGVPGGRVSRLRGVVVPVLEDALERSMSLAAGMDARGYGRSGTLTRGRRGVTGSLLLLGLMGICIGVYAELDTRAPGWLQLGGLLGGGLLAGFGLWSAGRRVQRTRYRPDRWGWAESGVALSGLAVAVGFRRLVPEGVRFPALDEAPLVTLGALGLVLVGLLAVAASPPPRLGPAPAPAAGARPDRQEVVGAGAA